MSDWLGALIGAAERTIRTLATHKRPKRNPIQQIVLQAKQAGIHPLVALQGGFSGQPLYGSNVDWSTDSGFGDAIGGLQNYLEEEQAYARSEKAYDRRRAEDRMFERELRQPTAQDKYFEQLTRESQSRTKLMEAEHALAGATTGHNSTFGVKPDIVPPFFDAHPEQRLMEFGKGTPAQEYENQEGEAVSEVMGFLNYLDRAFRTTAKIGKQWGDALGLPDLW